MLVEDVRNLIRSSVGNRAKESLVVDFIVVPSFVFKLLFPGNGKNLSSIFSPVFLKLKILKKIFIFLIISYNNIENSKHY